MKKIPLTQGKIAVVDDEDYEWLMQWKWQTQEGGIGRWYATRFEYPTRRKIYMHREIINAPKGRHVDHIDGNGLNNQRSNLRFATPAQNAQNSRAPSTNLSGYKGVSWNKDTQNWCAKIGINNKHIHLGKFSTPEEAAVVYNEAAKRLHGHFALLNTIPNEDSVIPRRLYRHSGSSNYIGVSWHTQRKKWRVRIWNSGKEIHIGLFDNEIDAAIAYDQKAKELHGDKAKLNFPDLS